MNPDPRTSLSPHDIERLIERFASTLGSMQRQPKQLSEAQQRFELQFRLIRNALGSRGGHGTESDDRALIDMVHRRAKGGSAEFVLEFPDGLPQHSQKVLIVRDRGHGYNLEVHVSAEAISVADVGSEPIRRVDVFDGFNTLIAAGVPSVGAATRPAAPGVPGRPPGRPPVGGEPSPAKSAEVKPTESEKE